MPEKESVGVVEAETGKTLEMGTCHPLIFCFIKSMER